MTISYLLDILLIILKYFCHFQPCQTKSNQLVKCYSQGFPCRGVVGALPPPAKNVLIPPPPQPRKIPPSRLPPHQIFIPPPTKYHFLHPPPTPPPLAPLLPQLNNNFQVVTQLTFCQTWDLGWKVKYHNPLLRERDIM